MIAFVAYFFSLTNEREQTLPSSDMPLWHFDYFELKVLEKQLVSQKDDLTILCPHESRKHISPMKSTLPLSGGTRQPYPQKWAV